MLSHLFGVFLVAGQGLWLLFRLLPQWRRLIRWSRAPNAALADALSTAFMVMNKKEIQTFCASYPEVACLGV